MTDERVIVCVVCPQGCSIKAALVPGGAPQLSGYNCPRGAEYAQIELTNPQRVLTTTVACSGGTLPLLPVRSRGPLPKDRLRACMHALADVSVAAPVKAGDVVARSILGTGVDIIATRSISASTKSW